MLGNQTFQLKSLANRQKINLPRHSLNFSAFPLLHLYSDKKLDNKKATETRRSAVSLATTMCNINLYFVNCRITNDTIKDSNAPKKISQGENKSIDKDLRNCFERSFNQAIDTMIITCHRSEKCSIHSYHDFIWFLELHIKANKIVFITKMTQCYLTKDRVTSSKKAH